MSKLEAALAWAKRGFRVFPLMPGTKDGYPFGAGWPAYATTSLHTIFDWWAEADYNVACLTTGHLVLDVDIKHGKAGFAAMHSLGLDTFETLAVRTPSGGLHLYYRGLDRLIGQHPIAPGIDVRSHNGYVLAPGSVIDGKPYEIDIDLPLASIPENIVPLLSEPRERADQPSNGHWIFEDSEQAIVIAAEFLASAPPAVEGDRGDDRTYRTICRIRDYGLSPEAALDVLWPWNMRSQPPWQLDELECKVRNAYRYATGIPGQASPLLHFKETEVPDPHTIEMQTWKAAIRGKARRRVRARPWVYKGFLMRSTVSLLTGPGGIGKTMLVLETAAHLAMGLDFLGHQCLSGPANSLIYLAEEDEDEYSRRLEAICTAFNFPIDVIDERITFISGTDTPLRLTLREEKTRALTINVPTVQALIERAQEEKAALIALEPLVHLHHGNENDNAEMSYVMKCAMELAKKADVSVLLGHHSSRLSQLNRMIAGNATASRGASTITTAARVCLTLASPEPRDHDLYGIPENDHGYTRLDDAKQNYAVMREPRWLRYQQLIIGSGDDVGVLVPCPDMHLQAAAVTQDWARILYIYIFNKHLGAISVTEACEALYRERPIYGRVEDLDKKLVIAFANPVKIEGEEASIQYTRDKKDRLISVV